VGRVRLSLGAFLHQLWQKGAFRGSKAEQGCFVKCDRTTIAQGDIDAGVLVLLVGFAPLKPAEFVIVKLRLLTSSALP
jgi:uncharacterized protein